VFILGVAMYMRRTRLNAAPSARESIVPA
jgi:hypothetical protein